MIRVWVVHYCLLKLATVGDGSRFCGERGGQQFFVVGNFPIVRGGVKGSNTGEAAVPCHIINSPGRFTAASTSISFSMASGDGNVCAIARVNPSRRFDLHFSSQLRP
jgi:hypothetical protein